MTRRGSSDGDVIYGELERRKRLLDRAQVSEVAEYEYRRIHLGHRLEPLPALIITIDEFTQMFLEHAESKKIIDEIGRQGRALNVGMILGSQRLGHEMQGGIMANIPIRVGLRTLDAGESMAVIGTDEAKHLPEKPAGAGLLRVQGRDRLVRFQSSSCAASTIRRGGWQPRRYAARRDTWHPSCPPPRRWPRSSRPHPNRSPRWWSRPNGARCRWSADTRDRGLHRFAAGTDPSAGSPDVASAAAAVASEQLVRRLRRKPWYEDYGNTAGLLFPVGIEDRPFQHAQRVYALDLSSGNCAVIGQKDAGKTTVLTTTITGAALMYHPKRVQFYVIAMGGRASMTSSPCRMWARSPRR